jgi:CubicO group peptidase (beta-lactamase class C family)
MNDVAVNVGSDLRGETRAEKLGFDAGRLDDFAKSVLVSVGGGTFDGARILVARHGELAFDGTFGFADRAAGRPLKPEDVFAVMSLVKSWTTVAALRLIERGDIQLTTRIADVIPEFAANGKQRITLEHVLTHTSGMPLGVPVPLELMGDLDANMKAIYAMAPQSTPGEVVSYSASVGYAILGDLVRRFDARGRSYRQIMQEDLLTPLRMTSSVVGMRPDLATRRVPIVVTDTAPNVFGVTLLVKMNELLTETAEIPGSGGWSSGADMLRFAEMLRRGGELDGARILSPAMLKLATTIHTGERPNNLYVMMREENLFEASPANLGLGFTIRGSGIHLTPFGTLAAPSAFGALGIGSMVYWVDPERDLSVVMLTAGLIGQYHNYSRFQRWSDMLISSLVRL